MVADKLSIMNYVMRRDQTQPLIESIYMLNHKTKCFQLEVFTKLHKPSKLLAKWHNQTVSQVIVHRTAPHCTTWCSAVCGFIIRKPHKPHCTAPHPFYILIYLFIFNIKYIINSLITLVFKKKKKV